MKRIFSSLTLVLCAVCSYADSTEPATPSNLHIYNTGGAAYVQLKAKGCNTTGLYYLSPDHKAFNSIFSILLTAQISSRQVVVNFNECINGNNPRGVITGVYLK